MPLVFSAITPHPPVLIPEIGKDNLDKLKKTQEAIEQLEQDLYAAKPDSIIVISTQENVSNDAFTINLSADYKADFKDFGDFGLELKFKSDFMSMQEIRAGDESNDKVSIIMNSDERLEHGFSVPLYFLTKHNKDVPIIPIAYSGLDYQAHYDFGKFLYDRLMKINKRFAVIASADLSHTLTKESPGGFNEKGQEFDDKVVKAIEKKDFKSIVEMDPALASAAKESGLKSILILLGILSSLEVDPKILSYEGPFGVGYCVCNMNLK